MKQQSIPITLARKILKDAKLNGYDLIGLTGGEVCLHPQFEELVDLIVKEGFYFGITSNGYEYKKYIPLLKYKEKFNYITFSMDGPSLTLKLLVLSNRSINEFCFS